MAILAKLSRILSEFELLKGRAIEYHDNQLLIDCIERLSEMLIYFYQKNTQEFNFDNEYKYSGYLASIMMEEKKFTEYLINFYKGILAAEITDKSNTGIKTKIINEWKNTFIELIIESNKKGAKCPKNNYANNSDCIIAAISFPAPLTKEFINLNFELLNCTVEEKKLHNSTATYHCLKNICHYLNSQINNKEPIEASLFNDLSNNLVHTLVIIFKNPNPPSYIIKYFFNAKITHDSLAIDIFFKILNNNVSFGNYFVDIYNSRLEDTLFNIALESKNVFLSNNTIFSKVNDELLDHIKLVINKGVDDILEMSFALILIFCQVYNKLIEETQNNEEKSQNIIDKIHDFFIDNRILVYQFYTQGFVASIYIDSVMKNINQLKDFYLHQLKEGYENALDRQDAQQDDKRELSEKIVSLLIIANSIKEEADDNSFYIKFLEKYMSIYNETNESMIERIIKPARQRIERDSTELNGYIKNKYPLSIVTCIFEDGYFPRMIGMHDI